MPLSISCDDPPIGYDGIPYSHFFPASGGTPPYTWSITAGHPPTGLALNPATGEISGTPFGVDDTNLFIIQVEDSLSETADVTCSITILQTSLSIICDSPPAGAVAVIYSHFFPVTGGVPPYTWSISAGALPPGLAIAPLTGEVSGTPVSPGGIYAFTVRVTDSLTFSGEVECSITITGGLVCPGGPENDVIPYTASYAIVPSSHG